VKGYSVNIFSYLHEKPRVVTGTKQNLFISLMDVVKGD
jgi:hypothetical protein